MALMLGALYHALLEAGAGDEPARRAAEEVAAYDARLAGIEREVSIVKWMIGTNIALTLIVLGTIASLAARLLPIGGR